MLCFGQKSYQKESTELNSYPTSYTAVLLRRLLLSYLITVTALYFMLPTEWLVPNRIPPLSVLSPLRATVIIAVLMVALSVFGYFVNTAPAERILIPSIFLILTLGVFLRTSFSFPYFWLSLIIEGIMIHYAIYGQSGTQSIPAVSPSTWGPKCFLITLSLALLCLLSLWGICRVRGFATPSYDFGIFAQMFHSMKTSGLPMTTLERDGLLSHFRVHVSPIYYLMLPFYILYPHPSTLQVLHAVVLVSSVIPLWLIGKHHGLSGWQRCLLCTALLLFPALAGGTSYDLHENCFLTPLILWLFLWIDRQKTIPIYLTAILIFMVKEDAAVYVAVIALWMIIRALLHSNRKETVLGLILLALSVGYFLSVTDYLATVGDGVMSERYRNLMPDGNESLSSVALVAVFHPTKMLSECVEPEKLSYIGLTMGALLGLPLLTRRYERFFLLIPYILVNLIPDYIYQHDIFFQYSFGSLACLFYLTAINLADLRAHIRLPLLIYLLSTCAVLFTAFPMPRAADYITRYADNREAHMQTEQLLQTIPEDATVTAGTFLTTYLSSREVIYDLGYASRKHLLESEYVVIDIYHEGDFAQYATGGKKNGYPNLLKLLQREGYQVHASLDNRLILFKKSN